MACRLRHPWRRGAHDGGPKRPAAALLGRVVQRDVMTRVTTAAPGPATVAILGGGSMSVPGYASLLTERHLDDYLPAGSTAVKLAVAGHPGRTSASIRSSSCASPWVASSTGTPSP